MKGPKKSVLTALSLGALLGWPKAEMMLLMALAIYSCMSLNLIPLLFLSKKGSLQVDDHWFGPYCTLYKGAPSLKNSLYILGPLLNFLTGLYLFRDQPSLLPFSLVPIFWAFFRLLPVEPFEGWFILRGLFYPLFGYWERSLSFLIAGLFFTCLSLYGLFHFIGPLYWISFIALGLAFYDFQNFCHFRKRGPADENPVLLSLYQEAIDLFKQNKGPEADQKLLQIIQSGIEGAISDQSRVIYAKGLLEQANVQKALEIISPCLSRSPRGSLAVLHRIAYQSNDFETVRKLAQKTWLEESEGSIAMINAIACAKLYALSPSMRLVEEVMGWLGAAKRMGYFPWDVLKSPDFTALESEPLFQDFKNTVFKTPKTSQNALKKHP